MAFLFTDQAMEQFVCKQIEDQPLWRSEGSREELLHLAKTQLPEQDWILFHELPLKALFFDFDGTMIYEETIDQLAALSGVGEQVAAITEQAMQGQLDFESSFRQRVKLLADLPKEQLLELAESLQLRRGLGELLNLADELKLPCFVVSGGFDWIIAERLKNFRISGICANRMSFHEQGHWLPQLSLENIIDARAKADYVEDSLQQYRLEPNSCLAFGDGANDIDMMRTLGTGVGICPKATLSPHLEGGQILDGDFRFAAKCLRASVEMRQGFQSLME